MVRLVPMTESEFEAYLEKNMALRDCTKVWVMRSPART